MSDRAGRMVVCAAFVCSMTGPARLRRLPHIAEALRATGHKVRPAWAWSPPAVHNGRPTGCRFVRRGRRARPRRRSRPGARHVDAGACPPGHHAWAPAWTSPTYPPTRTSTSPAPRCCSRRSATAASASWPFTSSIVVCRPRHPGAPPRAPATYSHQPQDPTDLATSKVFAPRCPSVPGAADDHDEWLRRTPLNQRSAYAMSKIAGEHLTTSSARLADGTTVGLRFRRCVRTAVPRDTPYFSVPPRSFRSPARERHAAAGVRQKPPASATSCVCATWHGLTC